MKTYKISIILPVYNVAPYLRTCLDSLTGQTLSDIEIIAVNDGSTDNSLSILEEYQKQFPDKLFLFTTSNHGVSHARNYGLQKAHGEYIWFVDSDDYVEKSACQQLYEKAIRDGNDLVLFRYYESNTVTGSKYASSVYALRDNFSIRENPSSYVKMSAYPWDKLIRRELTDELAFPEGIRFEDLPVAFTLCAKASSIGILNSCLYHYRTGVGFSSRIGTGNLDIIPATECYKNMMMRLGLYESLQTEVQYLIIRQSLVRFFKLLTDYDYTDKAFKHHLIDVLSDHLDTAWPDWKQNPYLFRNLFHNYYKMLYFFFSKEEMHRFVDTCCEMTQEEQDAWVQDYKARLITDPDMTGTAFAQAPPCVLPDRIPDALFPQKPRVFFHVPELNDKYIHFFNAQVVAHPGREYLLIFEKTPLFLVSNMTGKIHPDASWFMVDTSYPDWRADSLCYRLYWALLHRSRFTWPFSVPVGLQARKQYRKLFGKAVFSEAVIYVTVKYRNLLVFRNASPKRICCVEYMNRKKYEASSDYRTKVLIPARLLQKEKDIYMSSSLSDIPELQNLNAKPLSSDTIL